MTTPRPGGGEGEKAASRAAKLTRQQEDARRAMAGTLASAANLALQVETKKQDAAKADNKAKRTSKDGVAGKITAAAVVGEGDRAHRSRRVWILAIVVVVALIAVVIASSQIKSPERQTIEAFTIAETDFRKHRTERIQAIQERALLPNALPLVDVGSLRLGKPRTINLASAKTVIAQIKDLVYEPALDLWVPAEKLEDIVALWKPRNELDVNVALLGAKNITVVPQRTLKAKLTEAGLITEDLELLMQLMLRPSHDGDMKPQLSERLQAGNLPDAIDIIPFRGSKGTVLINLGRENSLRKVDYRGRLIRFVGAGWPSGCRVLDVSSDGA